MIGFVHVDEFGTKQEIEEVLKLTYTDGGKKRP
jgi:hypothetical protein